MAANGHKSVSIMSIAEELGISKTTVGYVLSGQAKKRRVADATAQRVLDAARKMNYVPHLWAKNLAKQSTGVIGLIVAGYEYNWTADIMNGVLPTLENDDFIPRTSIHMWDSRRCEQELWLAQQRRDEGVICQPIPGCEEAYLQLGANNIPLVFISDTLVSMPKISYVAWDSAPAVKKAVEHLIETGRKRIGFIGSSIIKLKLTQERFSVYRETLENAGIMFDPDLVRWSEIGGLVRRHTIKKDGSSQDTDDELAINELISELLKPECKLDALFFPHDSLALAVLRVLKKLGIKVPDDIAVMGMGDVPLADEFGVGLSTIREPLEEMGKVAAQTMLTLIEKPQRAPLHRLVPGSDLKIRRTTVG